MLPIDQVIVSTVINKSSRTTLERAPPCDYSGKKTDKFLRHGFKI